ncbi:hypothetical protein NDI56_05270 [Haloarcula sp. S1CR25-12]|uniref:Uncharacterized protein n=1 Tax=Haloarcula saliterrae TaxID=2950534 RepID=A0ABU2F9D4_9EURY|nr:hypothetical protein [Haloarcula sp. S1CR25-12]MDS0258802.1 hypothetical protein [Haloarcula sp. S1CR25-12]
MATIDSGERSSLAGLRVTGQTLLMLAFTLVETLALGLWLTLVESAPVISATSAIGLGVLSLGLVLEHVLTDATVNGVSASVLPDGQVVGVSVSEALLWVLWLGVAERVGGVDGVLVAGGLLAVLLVPQHTVEDNVLRDVDPLQSVVDLGTVGFSVVEAAGATVWLLLVFEGGQFAGPLATVGLGGVDPAAVGLGALAVVLFIEHDIGVALARKG